MNSQKKFESFQKNRKLTLTKTRRVSDEKQTKKKMTSNKIRTTKYRPWNFIFLSIWFELNKFTNLYFLITTIIQSIPSISTLDPITMIVPFLLILVVGLFREAVEDLLRFGRDRSINRSQARVFDPSEGAIKLKYWSDIQEGDLVFLIDGEETPADLLLIYCKSSTSFAYIETSNLDGEKNLKCKVPIRKYSDNLCFSQPEVEFLEVSYPEPVSNFYLFEGFAIDGDSKVCLSKDHFLPRGVFVKNTEYLLGLALYLGGETKIMMNNKRRKNKVSSTEKMMNTYVLILVVFEFLLLIIIAVLGTLSSVLYPQVLEWWGFKNPNLLSEFFVILLAYFILLNTFLPISLIITIELLRIFQSLFFKADDHFKLEGQPMMVNTVSLNEELGKIEYVLSDKTGTLTKNQMKAKYFAIGFHEFDLDSKGKVLSRAKRETPTPGPSEVPINMGQPGSSSEDSKTIFPIRLPSNEKDKSFKINNQSEFEFLFFLLLNTCHDCFCQTKKSKAALSEEQLLRLGQDVMRESMVLQPRRPFLDTISLKFFSKRNSRSKNLLLDVPKQQFSERGSHYLHVSGKRVA